MFSLNELNSIEAALKHLAYTIESDLILVNASAREWQKVYDLQLLAKKVEMQILKEEMDV